MQRVYLSVLVVCGLTLMPSTAQAGSILFQSSGPGVSGVTLSASAMFEITGSTLKITLRNAGDTSGANKDLAANTLTGVFFSLPTGISLTPVSATIAKGALLQADKCDIGPCSSNTTNVGGEFMYNTGSWAGHAGSHGIASSGYVGGKPNFNGPDLDSPLSPDGINFGIVAPITASNPFIAENGNMRDNPLIEEQVVFTMTIAGGSLLESQISNVSFQYGTDLSEPKLPPGFKPPPPIPEPATLLLLGPAGAAVLWQRRRRAKSAR